GTARSGESSTTRYPWGAHYVPVPDSRNTPLIALLREMGVIERLDSDGEPIVAEQYLVRDPEERVFSDGLWLEGLFPNEVATEDDLRDLANFQRKMRGWADWRDEQGRMAFTIPVAGCSDDK